MLERGLILSDVLFVLKNGFIFDDPDASTLSGFFKYKMEGRSPNSGSRTLRIVVIPDPKSPQIKVITVMWRDEK